MKIQGKRGDRGASILVLSLFFMTVLFLLAMTFFNLVPADFHAASRSHADLNGHYVARAGIEKSMAWLSSTMEKYEATQQQTDLPDYSPDGTSFPNVVDFLSKINSNSGVEVAPFEAGKWHYEVDIRPADNSGLPIGRHDFQAKYFSVSSIAFLNDKPIRRIDVVLKQRTFSSMAFYTFDNPEDAYFLVDGTTKISGPVHTNGFFNFKVNNDVWDDADANPYFTDVVSHSSVFGTPAAHMDGNNWGSSAPFDDDAVIEGRYSKVFKGGRNNLKRKQSIPLPSSSDGIIAAVWNQPTAPPTDRGVHISLGTDGKVNGGIYVHDSVDAYRLELDETGNQRHEFVQWHNDGTYETEVWVNKAIPGSNRTEVRQRRDCIRYEVPSGSGGSGVEGGSLNKVCVEYGPYYNYNVTVWDYEQVKETRTYTDTNKYQTDIIEVVEGPVTYTDASGAPKTAQVGETLYIKRKYEDGTTGESVGWKVLEAESYGGQLNGTTYVNGNIGTRTTSVSENSDKEGLWGIVKGSALLDVDGSFLTDDQGEIQYQNKTIATPLNNSINISGDLLQFNPKRFETTSGVKTSSSHTAQLDNWRSAALDPNAVDEKERFSPNNQHVLGIVTRDVWLKGPKNPSSNPNNWSHKRTGGDGFSDIYAVILAGKTEIIGGKEVASGGFGTYKNERDALGDGLGKCRVWGGVIQGTTGQNRGDSSSTHYWITSGVGYDISMFYDIEATKQRLFPTYPEFRTIRYFEQSMRDRTV